jgi:nitrite reductase/ring-hydroxylating ferredoxin subunit
VNIVNSKGKLYAVNNVCPHKAAPLHRGTVTDIEDIAKISCLLHGWTFSLHDGKSDANSFVLDIYDIKIKDDQVWVSFEKKNSDIEGDRRDFNGQELIYNPGLGWI